jgi:hypothetical protein
MSSCLSQTLQSVRHNAVNGYDWVASKVSASYEVLHRDVTALFQGRSVEVFKALPAERQSDIVLKVAFVALTSIFLPTIPVIILATLTFARLSSQDRPGLEGLTHAFNHATRSAEPSLFARLGYRD